MASRQKLAARWMGFGLGAMVALAPLAAYASAVDQYYERALMTAANERCRLFTPELASSLVVAQVLARGVALRAGIEEDQLYNAASRARTRAASQACNSPDLALAAGRVRAMFDGYSKIQKMNYAGDIKDWSAVRQASAAGRVWNLSQPATFGADKLTFGLAGKGGAADLVAVVQFADGATPYAARLVMRDKTKSPRPYLDTRGASLGTLPLNRRITPRAQSLAYFADAKFTPDVLMRPEGARSIAYSFPDAAVDRLSGLDPREAIQIEFLFATASGRDQVRTAYIEVGDFAAGRAFLTVVAAR